MAFVPVAPKVGVGAELQAILFGFWDVELGDGNAGDLVQDESFAALGKLDELGLLKLDFNGIAFGERG